MDEFQRQIVERIGPSNPAQCLLVLGEQRDQLRQVG